jgi:hypothetical protein
MQCRHEPSGLPRKRLGWRTEFAGHRAETAGLMKRRHCIHSARRVEAPGLQGAAKDRRASTPSRRFFSGPFLLQALRGAQSFKPQCNRPGPGSWNCGRCEAAMAGWAGGSSAGWERGSRGRPADASRASGLNGWEDSFDGRVVLNWFIPFDIGENRPGL